MSHPKAHELDLSVVLAAIEGGSRAAFKRLYDCYADKVRYAVARAALHTCHTRDVDDLNQEVWCRLLGNERRLLRYYDPKRGRFAPFISTVAYQQALVAVGRYRRQVPRGNADVGDDSLVDGESLRFADDLVQGELSQKLLAKADAELGDGERMLLREIHLDGRTCRSVALQLGVRENAIQKRNERLKKKLERLRDELLRTSPHPVASQLPLAVVLGLVAVALDMQAPAANDYGAGVEEGLPRFARAGRGMNAECGESRR